jgi:hypothetical protein
MPNSHYLLGKERPSSFDPDFGKSAFRIFVEGTRVSIEGEMYDHEDNRLYEQGGSFGLVDFIEALQRLHETGEVIIDAPRYGSKLALKRKQEIAEITLVGDSLPGSTPGGAAHSSTAMFHLRLDELLRFSATNSGQGSLREALSWHSNRYGAQVTALLSAPGAGVIRGKLVSFSDAGVEISAPDGRRLETIAADRIIALDLVFVGNSNTEDVMGELDGTGMEGQTLPTVVYRQRITRDLDGLWRCWDLPNENLG